MVNNTVKGKRLGRAAGSTENTKLVFGSVRQGERTLDLLNSNGRHNDFNDYLVVKAYDGGRPRNNESVR